ncbi:hypothetical protein AB0881_36120, partial [Spirillospora sp. NPDC029432]
MARGLKIGLFLAAVSTLVTALFAGGVAAAEPARADASAAPSGRTVLIGVPGLMWKDVGEKATPTLWRLVGQGAGGGLSVRTTKVNTCPTDGWLTLSAGRRGRGRRARSAMPRSAPCTRRSRPGPG